MDTFQERKEYVERMKQFIAEHQNKISSLLQTLSWSPEHIVKKCERVACPYDSSHVVPVNSLKKHMETCQYISQGCPKEEVHLQLLQGTQMSSSSIFQPQRLDDMLINRIIRSGPDHADNRAPRRVPVSQEDYVVNFQPGERLAIYEYFQWEFKEANERLNVEKDELLTIDWQAVIKKGGLNKAKPKSKAEVLAEMRDQRRRRQTYRAKNVHLTMKSYTEVMREVIKNQIELLGGGNQLEKSETETDRDDQQAEPCISRSRSSRESKDRSQDRSQDREMESDRQRHRDRDRHHERREHREREEEINREDRRRRREDHRREKSSRKHKHHRRSRDRSHTRSREDVDVEIKHEPRSHRQEVAVEPGGGLLDDDEFSELFEDDDVIVVKQETEEIDTCGISEQELFDIKKVDRAEMESQASGAEDRENEGESTTHSRSRKSKHKHKHKHKHRHRHRHESVTIELTD